jgi:mono/diheme cytochrome c family protein
MPTWGTVLSPNQVDDLVALIAAWRNGQQVLAEFSVIDLIDSAIFSLQNGDSDSAALHLEHAMQVAQAGQLDALRAAGVQLAAGDQEGALSTLQTLGAGDPTAGAALYSANCAACHGAQGEGGIGKALQANEFIKSQSNTQLVEFLLAGRPGTAMAGFKDRLSETEIANVIALLRLWNP